MQDFLTQDIVIDNSIVVEHIGATIMWQEMTTSKWEVTFQFDLKWNTLTMSSSKLFF